MKVIFYILSILLITSCFQMDDYKNDFFNNQRKITNTQDSYTFLQRSLDVNSNEINLTFSSLSGSDTIFSKSYFKDDIIEFDLSQDLQSGEVKVVIITPDNDVKYLYPGSNRFIAHITGIYTIKVLAYNASGNIHLTIY